MFILCLFENPQENTLPSLTPQLPNALRSLALRVGRLTWESPFNIFYFWILSSSQWGTWSYLFGANWLFCKAHLFSIDQDGEKIPGKHLIFKKVTRIHLEWEKNPPGMRKRNPSGMRKKSTWDALSRWEHFQQQWRPLSWWIGVENIGLLYSEHSVCYHVTQTHCVFDLCVAVLPVYNETIVLPIASPNVQTLHMSRPCPRLLHIFFHLEVKAELTWKFQISPGRQ